MLAFGSTEETGSTYIVSDVQAAWYVEQARVSGYMRALHDVLRQLVSLQYALARADKRQEESGCSGQNVRLCSATAKKSNSKCWSHVDPVFALQ